jgi:CheY-like chemotaxis protein
MKYWQRFYGWLVPQVLQEQIEKKTQVTILVVVFLCNIFICLSTLTILELIFDLPAALRFMAWSLTLVPIVLYIAAFWVLRKTASIVWATNVAVVGIFLDDLFAVVITGGYSTSPLISLFILAPLIAFLLAGPRSGIFWSAVAIASQLMLIFMEQRGLLVASSIADNNVLFLLHLSIPVILNFMFFVALYFFGSINTSLRHKLIGINATLQNHSTILDQHNKEIGLKNKELERSKQVLLQKSKELEASGRYKSEFLSTMSHELRTPLNSILILSRALMDNRAGHLTAKEIEHASVINSAGSDLLNLINDILDLSKVEEGKLDLVYENIPLTDIAKELDRQFKFITESRGLDFSVNIAKGLPAEIEVDAHRLNQILKNFISNALKFTQKGGIYVDIYRPQSPFLSLEPHLNESKAIVIAVRDTGKGIPKNKQEVIFEAFKQADGTTARKYGGTGLGLTISRQLAGIMKGEISVYSMGEGMGSSFGLILPTQAPQGLGAEPTALHVDETPLIDNAQFSQAQRCNKILIVEDDEKFAKILLDLIIEERLDCDIVYNGSDCLLYLTQFIPTAIILDLTLPDMSGWDILKKIKSSPQLRHIPVRIVSAAKPEQQKAKSLGAASFIEKPVAHTVIQEMLMKIKDEVSGSFKRILIIEDSIELHKIIGDQFAEHGIAVQFAENAGVALALMKQQSFDCFIVDLRLPDYDGVELLKVIRALPDNEDKPIIVFTAMTLSAEKEFEISRYADRVIVKAPRALESLVDTTSMFLHLVARPLSSSEPASSPDSATATTITAEDAVATDKNVFIPLRDYIPFSAGGLDGCHVLLVDDDIRNVYSMSAVLDGLGVVVTVATSGTEALEKLQAGNKLQLILMDIMMPEMDGYEATRQIRKLPQGESIPIIALTAKAMPEDRKLCLDAGADDYVTKPVDMEHLKRVMYTWLKEGHHTP